MSSNVFMIGTFRLGRRYLEALRHKGQTLNIRIVGTLIVEQDVSAELIDVVAAKADVRGWIQGKQDVVELLKQKAGRIR